MSSITVDDDEDVVFQADLARAIAASLEPDPSGPIDDVGRGETSNWNALLAAGQVATWSSQGPDKARRSPAVQAADEDDDDFQRQMAAALAASIQSAEEDRRRREEFSARGAPWSQPLSHAVPTYVPPHLRPQAGGVTLHQQQHQQHQQQPQQQHYNSQGVLKDSDSVCCSGGLLLKPLTASRGANAAPLPVTSASTFHVAISSKPTWPSDCAAPEPAATGPMSAAPTATAGQLAATAGDVIVARATVGRSPVPLGATPACSPCSSDGEASVGARQGTGAAAATSHTATGDPPRGQVLPVPVPHLPQHPRELQLEASLGQSGPTACVYSASPGKHSRTLSLTGAVDAAQPQSKRSRPASDSGAGPLLLPARRELAAPGDCSGQGNPAGGLAVMAHPDAAAAAAAAAVTATAWGEGEDRSAMALSRSHSPPERPASAASVCTAAAADACADATGTEEDGGLDAATAARALAGVDAQQQQQRALLNATQGASLLFLDLRERIQVASDTVPVFPQWGYSGSWTEEAAGDGGVFGGSASGAAGPRALSSIELQGGFDGLPPGLLPQPPLPPPAQQQQQPPRHGCFEQAGGAATPRQVSESDSFGKSSSSNCGIPCWGESGRGGYSLNLSSGGVCRSANLWDGTEADGRNPHRPSQPQDGCERQRQEDELEGHQKHQLQQHQQPPGGASGSHDGGARGSAAPLDLSRPAQVLCAGPGRLSVAVAGSESALFHRQSHGHEAAAAAPAPPALASVAAGRLDSADAMLTDLPAVLYSADGALDAAAATAPPPPLAEAPMWVYSAADRRMLLHQRVWWWLGPGQVQAGTISAIDRRSEPLLYTVRLDPDLSGAAGQTIIATADSLFPYLVHGDQVMCRLPPSDSDATATVACAGGSDVVIGGSLSLQATALQRRMAAAEWPGLFSEAGAGGGFSAAAVGPVSCAWMCGTLQHCMFDGHTPMVHVLLGPDEQPYSAPYEFVVPVSDAAEGSGTARGDAAVGLVAAGEPLLEGPGVGYGPANNPCLDIVPVGPAA